MGKRLQIYNGRFTKLRQDLELFYFNLAKTHEDLPGFDIWFSSVCVYSKWGLSGVVLTRGKDPRVVWTNIYIDPGTFPRKKYFFQTEEVARSKGVEFIAVNTSNEFGRKFSRWLDYEQIETDLFRKVL